MTIRTAYQGLLIPGATVSTSTSTYTEQGPRVGRVVPSAATSLVLAASGVQKSSTTFTLQVQRAGHPIRGEAGIIYRRATGPGPWYGHNPPHLLTGFSNVTLNGTDLSPPSGVSIAETAGQVLLCAYQRISGAATKLLYVAAWDGSAWATPVLVTSGASYSYWPCLVPLPDGRVLVLSWITAGTEASIRVHYSDDDGATWAVYQPYASATPLDTGTYTPKRIAAAYSGGQILVLADVEETGATNVARQIGQYASDDLGATFHEVVAPTDSTTTGYAWPSVVGVEGGGFVAAALSNDANNTLAAWRLGTAWQPITALERLTPAANTEAASIWSGAPADLDSGRLSLAKSSAGDLYLYYLIPSVSGSPGMVSVSYDGGFTWERMGRSARLAAMGNCWWGATPGVALPDDFQAVEHRGRMMLAVAHADTGGGARPNALDVLQLGDHATVTSPSLGATPRQSARVGWDYTWVPWGLPDVVAEDTATAATGTVSFAADYMQIDTLLGQSYVWQYTPGGTAAEGVILMVDVEVTSATAMAQANTFARARAASGGVGYEVGVLLSVAQLRVVDVNAGPATLATVTLDGGTYPDQANGVRILIAISSDAYAVWVAPAASTAETTWVLVDSGTGLTDDAGAGGAACFYEYGHGAAIATTQSRWRMRCAVSDEYTGAQLAGGFTSPDDLFPVPLSPQPVELAEGTKLRGLSGPGEYGTTYTLAPDAEYAISRLDYTNDLSPRRPWLSVDDSAAVLLDYLWPDITGDAWADGVDAIRLSACNWRTGTLEINTGAAYTSILSVDLATGRSSLPFVRLGNTVSVNLAGAPAGSEWIDRAELVGHTISLDDGGGTVVRRTISACTDGTWSSTGRLLRLTLSDALATDPASGTAAIWSADALIVIRRPNAGTDPKPRRRGYRLTIAAQDTVSGAFSCKMMVGEVAIFDLPPDEGSQRVTESPIEVYEAADGSVSSAVQVGPVRRGHQVSWSDGAVLEHTISGASPVAPGVYEASSTALSPAIAARGGTARMVEGLVKELAGLSMPVTLIRWLPAGTPDVTITLSPRHFCTGLLEGPVQVDEVQAVRRSTAENAERAGKMVRIGSIALRELV